MFAAKLSEVGVLGSNLDWEEKSRSLQKIKPLIDAAKLRLRADNKVVPN